MNTNSKSPLSSKVFAYYSCPNCGEWVAFDSSLSRCTNCKTLLQIDDSPYPRVVKVKQKS